MQFDDITYTAIRHSFFQRSYRTSNVDTSFINIALVAEMRRAHMSSSCSMMLTLTVIGVNMTERIIAENPYVTARVDHSSGHTSRHTRLVFFVSVFVHSDNLLSYCPYQR